MQEFMALPAAARIAIVIVGVLQLSLQVWSLVELSRRPSSGGNQKLVWTLVIVFGGLVGTLVYLGVGRKALDDAVAREAAATRDSLSGGRSEEGRRAIDRLYGDHDA